MTTEVERVRLDLDLPPVVVLEQIDWKVITEGNQEQVFAELKKANIYFAGIDFIKGKLIGDINVTSPTGLKTYYDLTGVNLAEYFFDNI